MPNNNWMTPPEIYEPILNFIGRGRFDLDACCSESNIPAINHAIDGSVDGLRINWAGEVWCNPPYGRGLINQWVKKCSEEKIASTWAIVNNCTETTWFQRYCFGAADFIVFLSGRVAFLDPVSKQPVSDNLRGQCIVHWCGDLDCNHAIDWIIKKPLPGTVWRPM